jgi:2-oxoglutarate dehydrogenase N-terminus
LAAGVRVPLSSARRSKDVIAFAEPAFVGAMLRENVMARQDLNEALAQTSFLFGGNAAYIEDLYAQYATDPNAVDAEWQAFFSALRDDDRIVTKAAEGASWARPNWPVAANGELIAALDGNWASIEAAVGGKVRQNPRRRASRSRKPRFCRRPATACAP